MVTDGRPILVGVGRVEDLGSPESYETEDAEDWSCLLPYRAVEHSIRPAAKQGFVFPLDQFVEHPEAAILCPVPPELDLKGEATLLDHDGAWALMTAAERCWERILEQSQGYSPLPWLRHQRLRLREWRGDSPGAASALRALGLRHGPAVLAGLERGSGPHWSVWRRRLRIPPSWAASFHRESAWPGSYFPRSGRPFWRCSLASRCARNR